MSKFSAINEFIQEPEQVVENDQEIQQIRQPLPEEEPKELDFRDVMSRTLELEWIGPGFDRIKKDKSFKRDPSFTFDNPEQYLESVPLEYQPRVRENLTEARSDEHARYIVDQTMEEYKTRELINSYGVAGQATAFMGAMMDPAALALDVIAAPLGGAAQGGRLIKSARLNRAAKAGLIAAGENAAIEEYLRQNSMTRTAEDVMYAGAFGMMLGGAFGALGRIPGKQKSAKPDTIADDMNNKLAEVGHKTTEQLDELVVARATGKEFAGPKAADDVLNYAELEFHKELEATRPKVSEPDAPVKAKPEVDIEAINARLTEVDTKVTQLRKTELPPPTRSKLIGMVDDVSRALEEFDAAVAAGKGGPNAEIKVNNAKRHFLNTAREEGISEVLDSMKKLFVGINPKLAEFRKFHGRMTKLAEKMEKKYQGEYKDWDAKLTEIDDEVAALTKEGKELRAKLEADKPDLEDSAGAARATEAGTTRDFTRYGEGDPAVVDDFYANVPRVLKRKSGRFGIWSQLAASANSRSRHLGRRLFENVVGHKDGTVNAASAEFEKRTMKDVFDVKIREVSKEQYPKWLEERGYNWFQGQTQEVQEEFGRAVYMARQTGNGTPSELRTANAFTDAFQYGADQAQEWEVKGFTGKIFDSSTYTPRKVDSKKYKEVQRTHTRTDVRKGEAKSVGEEWHRRALISAVPGLDNVLAMRIAKHLDDVFRSKKVGLNTRPDIMSADRLEDLKNVMLEAGVDPADVTDFAMAFEKAHNNPQAGINARAKRRMGMDMSVVVDNVEDADGNIVTITQHDLYETNMFNLADNYGNSVLGQASIAKVFRFDPDNKMRSYEDYERAMNAVRAEEDSLAERGHTLGGVTHNVDSELDLIKRLGFDAILGKPPVDPNLGATKLSRLALAYNYIGDMGKVALAQLAETGGVISAVGVRTTLRHMPGLKDLIQKTFKNQPNTSDALANAVRRDLGVGTHNIRGSGTFKGMEHDPNSGVAQIHNNTDYVLYKTGRMVGWLNETLMDFQQVTMGKGIMQNDFAAAIKGKKMRTSARRLAASGIDDDMQARILSQLKEHGEAANGKHIDDPKFDNWTDKEAADAYKTSVRRRIQRNIQENYTGSTHQMQHSNLGKVVLQYRSFIMAAWENSLMHNASVRDWESLSYFINTTIMSSLSTYAFMALSQAGHEDYDRRMAELTKPESFFKTAIARTAWAGLAPSAADSVSEFFTGEPIFSPYRSSELKNSLLDWQANPTGSRMAAAGGLLKAAVMLPTDDYRLSMEQWYDFKALTPFRTMPLISNFLNMAGDKLKKELPKRSQIKYDY